MKRFILLACLSVLSGCAGDENMTPKVRREFADCEARFPDKVGNYADQSVCKANSAIRSYRSKGKDTSSLMRLANMQTDIWKSVDSGEISPEEGKLKIEQLGEAAKNDPDIGMSYCQRVVSTMTDARVNQDTKNLAQIIYFNKCQ